MIDATGIKAFMKALGSVLAQETRVYLLGGASGVMGGWRTGTDTIDVIAVPDRELVKLLPRLSQDSGCEIVLRAPNEFIPPLPDWESRSQEIGQEGRVSFFHFDFYSQALGKIERAAGRDTDDVRAMISRGLIQRKVAMELFREIEPEFPNYPTVDGPVFRHHVEIILAGFNPGR